MLAEKDARAFATEFVEYACGKLTGGRSENDPVYQAVTEGRDRGRLQKTYSSCGDLAHWLLFRMGCRSRFINRKEHLGWKVGANVSALAFSSLAEAATETAVYHAGDILIIWDKPTATDAHVLVVLEHAGEKLISGEYGQPGGAVREHDLKRPGWIGKRKMQRALRLSRVMADAERHSLLLEPDYTTLPIAQAYLIEHSESPAGAGVVTA
jgi:hypothetical protein